MNILVLHSELGVLRGGGENFTRNLFAAFHKRGHDVRAAFRWRIKTADIHSLSLLGLSLSQSMAGGEASWDSQRFLRWALGLLE